MLRSLALVVLLVVGLGTEAGRAQAWTQDAGRAYLRIIQSVGGADERFDADGVIVPYDETTGGDFRDRSLYLYGEVGLTDGLTLVGLLPYKRLYVTDGSYTPAFERQSFAWGSAVAGLRFDIGPALGLDPEGPTVMAANVAVSLPMGYTRNYRPAVGPGQMDVQASMDIGRSLWPFPGYAQAGLGYRHRTAAYGLSNATACPRTVDDEGHACLPDAEARRDYGDEFMLRAEAGLTPGPVLLQVLLDGAWSVGAPGGDTTLPVLPQGFERQRLVRLGLGAGIQGPWGFGLGAQVMAPAYARNALKATEIFVGLEKRF